MAFLRLIIAHLAADFFLQSRRVMLKRTENFQVGRWHYLIHAGCYGLLFFGVLRQPLVWQGIALIVISHAILDELKLRYLKIHPGRDNLLLFWGDQLLHFLILLLVAGWWQQQGLVLESSRQLVELGGWAVLILGSTYGLSIMLNYLKPPPQRQRYRRDYGGMLMRLALAAAIFAGYWPVILGAMVGLVVHIVWLHRLKLNHQGWLYFINSLLFTVAWALGVRLLVIFTKA